jgi:hypothetical protein
MSRAVLKAGRFLPSPRAFDSPAIAVPQIAPSSWST